MAKLAGLNPGDRIDLVAPASQCDNDLLSKGVDVLKAWGYKVSLPRNIFNSHPYLANTDETRFEHLKNALMDQSSKAVWVVRGGYGSSRLFSELRKLKPRQQKMIIGYSDITWLHLFAHKYWGWKTVHGPLVAELGTDKLTQKTMTTLKKFLSQVEDVEFTNLKAINSYAIKRKVIKGKTAGGNLAVLQTTLGTPYAFNGKGKIIFFEDIGERGYSIDRILTHMTHAGVFKGAKAVVFGHFTDGVEASGKSYVRRAINEFAQEAKVPVLSGMKVGHSQDNWPVLLNTSAELKLGTTASLVVKNI